VCVLRTAQLDLGKSTDYEIASNFFLFFFFYAALHFTRNSFTSRVAWLTSRSFLLLFNRQINFSNPSGTFAPHDFSFLLHMSLFSAQVMRTPAYFSDEIIYLRSFSEFLVALEFAGQCENL
jgi:hypothetical protein